MEEYFNAQQLCVYAVIAIWIWTKRLMFSLLASVHFLDLPAEFGFKVQRDHSSRPVAPMEMQLDGKPHCQGQFRRSRYSNNSQIRSEEHTSELQSLMRISYAVFCLKKKKQTPETHESTTITE